MADFKYNIEQLELESLAQSSKITLKDSNLIGTYEVDNVFSINQSRVGVGVYTIDNTLLEYIPNYKGYTFGPNAQIEGERGASILTIDPEQDIQKLNYNTGDVRVVYNFTNNLFSENQDGGEFFIQEISSDRTELKLLSLTLKKEEIQAYVKSLKSKLEDSAYFSQFRVDFGDNRYNAGINVDTLETTEGLVVLVKLYSPLLDTVSLKDSLTLEEIVSDSLLYEITAAPLVDTISIPYIKGPNFSLEEVDKVNEPTKYLNYNELFSYPVSGSYYELFSLFNNAGAEIAINHNDYSDFIHFSSAEERLRNFQYKLQLLESYETSLNTISASNATESGSFYQTEVTGSNTYYEGLIRGLVDNFDHYDRFLYFSSGSEAWPKTNSQRPYSNYATTSSVGLTWFNQQLITASNFDVSNFDQLANSIPTFIREGKENEPYLMFIHMIAQHFDNLWIYFKAVGDKYDADNRLNFGVSKDIVREVVESFGINLYNSNQNTDNLFSMFLGETPVTGSETINTMSIATSASFNSGSTALEYLQPVPKSDYEKEVYKRIYHNLPHLVKTKGTERGLRALINCFGIPESILSIKTFGGKSVNEPMFGALMPQTSSLFISNSINYRSGSVKIRTDNTGSYTSGSTLSQFVSIEQRNKKYTDDGHNVEVGFDISHGTNEHILRKISSSYDIDAYIGDPRRRYKEGYPELDAIREKVIHDDIHWDDITQLWNSGSWAWEDQLAPTKSPKSFVRLLKFFDSSIFKIIKDFVPARGKVDTGIIIKSNNLGRSKAKQVEVSFTNEIHSASIITNTFTGSTGGSYDSSGSFDYTTNYNGHVMTPLGPADRNVTDESPMFNGELSGSVLIATDGEVGKKNPFLDLAQPLIELDITVFNFSLPPPPACVIALTGSYIGEAYTIGVVDEADYDETVAITYPLAVANITSSYNFAHDYDVYEFFTIEANATYSDTYYDGTYGAIGANFTGWYTKNDGTGTLISTNNPLTIYRYSDEEFGNEFYAKFENHI